MRIIILGAGEVGMDAARMLSTEQHSVTVIDNDAARLKRISDRYDVLAVEGNGTSASVLRAAGVENTDLLLAVTSVDEVNIIASMIAQRLGAKHTVARVRSDELAGDRSVLAPEETGIELVINPEESGARDVVRLIMRSCATDVVPLADGRVQVVGMRLGREDHVIGKSLQEVAGQNPGVKFRIVGISRGIRTLLPTGQTQLRPNDQIFFLARTEDVPKVVELMGRTDVRMDHVMILGGTSIGYRVAAQLSRETKMKVKLIEADRERAEDLAEALGDVLIIHGDPTDIDLLATEGIGEMDALIALTDNEEANLVTSLLGKHIGVKRTIALLSKGGYIPISQSIGLDAAVNQKLSVANEIMRFLRSKNVHNVATVHGLDAEILEIEAQKGSRIARLPLRSAELPAGILIGATIAEGKVEIATGDTWILPGDRAIVFAMERQVGEVERLFGKR